MTTIAWDGKTLAADRCGWTRDLRIETRPKVHKIKSPDGTVCLIAFCGNMGFSQHFLGFLKGHRDKPEEKQYGIDEAYPFCLVLTDKKRCFLVYTSLLYEERPWGNQAVGAGDSVAWGALDAGASAKRAIEIAIKRTDNAGMAVDTVKF